MRTESRQKRKKVFDIFLCVCLLFFVKTEEKVQGCLKICIFSGVDSSASLAFSHLRNFIIRTIEYTQVISSDLFLGIHNLQIHTNYTWWVFKAVSDLFLRLNILELDCF